MISTGNDIVCLKSVNKNRTKEPRFYSKILSLSEQTLYHQPALSAVPFENYVWLLWSIKEAAYKFFKRNDPGLAFSPTKFVVTAANVLDIEHLNDDDVKSEFFSGEIRHAGKHLYFRSKITADFIATVVNDSDDFRNVTWRVKTINGSGYKQQSEGAREFLLTQLNNCITGNLKVEKSPVGYPVILNEGLPMQLPVSLAHDGCFVSYSFINSATNLN